MGREMQTDGLPDLLYANLENPHWDEVSERCLACGNCTAVCPLSTADATFPRRIIRYAQVGMKSELLGSKELWTCYGCGECSGTCPRQAEPSEFMAASRRYATAAYDRTRIARFLYLQPLWGTIAAIALAVAASLGTGRTVFLDVAVGLALVGFVATIGWARLIQRARQTQPGGTPR